MIIGFISFRSDLVRTFLYTIPVWLLFTAWFFIPTEGGSNGYAYMIGSMLITGIVIGMVTVSIMKAILNLKKAILKPIDSVAGQ
jgi:hypothetical protein